MIDPRIGKRFKEAREKIGLTQEELAEKSGLSTNYISTVERGSSFPRCEKLILLMNALDTSADAIFCDVVPRSNVYLSGSLSEAISELPVESQSRILEVVELLVRQEKQRY